MTNLIVTKIDLFRSSLAQNDKIYEVYYSYITLMLQGQPSRLPEYWDDGIVSFSRNDIDKKFIDIH